MGAVLAMTGASAQCVVIAAIVVKGAETSWFPVAAPIAIATWFAGSVLLAIAIRRARVMPAWVGFGLPLVTLFAVVGASLGTSVLIGAFQVVVGLRIARAAGATAPQPAIDGLRARA